MDRQAASGEISRECSPPAPPPLPPGREGVRRYTVGRAYRAEAAGLLLQVSSQMPLGIELHAQLGHLVQYVVHYVVHYIAHCTVHCIVLIVHCMVEFRSTRSLVPTC